MGGHKGCPCGHEIIDAETCLPMCVLPPQETRERILFLGFLLLPAGQAEPADQLSQVRAALRLEEEVEVTFDSVSEESG